MKTNVINFLEQKAKRDSKKNIEDLDIRVCTYNFLKKLKISVLSELHKFNWVELAKEHKHYQYIVEDLQALMPLKQEA